MRRSILLMFEQEDIIARSLQTSGHTAIAAAGSGDALGSVHARLPRGPAVGRGPIRAALPVPGGEGNAPGPANPERVTRLGTSGVSAVIVIDDD